MSTEKKPKDTKRKPRILNRDPPEEPPPDCGPTFHPDYGKLAD